MIHAIITPEASAAIGLVPDPSYPSNAFCVSAFGGLPVPVRLRPVDYQLDPDAFAAAVTPRTKAIALTHPNNPTGTVFNRDGLEALARLVVEHDLVLVCDQAFEDHVYDGREFVVPAALPDLWERTITLTSVSKGYGLCGLRVGFIVADTPIMDVLHGAIDLLGGPSPVGQAGALAALEDDTILPERHAVFERGQRLAVDVLAGIPGVRVVPPESGIMCWLDVSGLGTGDAVAAHLLREGVMVATGSHYGAAGEHGMRIITACFLDDADMLAALRRVRAGLESFATR